MKNKKICFTSFLLVIVLLGLTCLITFCYDKNNILVTTNNKSLAIFLSDGSVSNKIPVNNENESYYMNRLFSYCESGSKIGKYDSSKGTVEIDLNGSDFCYLYFNRVNTEEYNKNLNTSVDYSDNSNSKVELLIDGYYKLEAWGAQGSDNSYGAYTSGIVYLKKTDNLYVTVGNTSGYNYSGTNIDYLDNPLESTGGGATHFAFSSGTLVELKDYYLNKEGNFKPICSLDDDTCSSENALTYDSNIILIAAFGGKNDSNVSGLGYTGSSKLTNKATYCFNCEEKKEEAIKTINTTCVSDEPTSLCSKMGNGFARITYLGFEYNK